MKRDIAIIGAGPAGLSLATELARADIAVKLIDEQPYPGGQIYRASEKVARAPSTILDWLGADYCRGLDLIEAARREKNIEWHFGTSVWDIDCQENAIGLGVTEGKTASIIKAREVVLATGAMERPTPFAGWNLPGVMGVGAAQTLLKDSGMLPCDGVVLAGSGPLLYLYAHQLISAGVRPGAVLDTARKWPTAGAVMPLLKAAIGNLPQLTKGLAWRAEIARSDVEHLFAVEHLEAVGSDGVESVRYRQQGQSREIETSLLLVHDGIVPNTHLTQAANCEHVWNEAQHCWQPRLDQKGQTSQAGLWVIGDGAGIMGGESATLQGRGLARHLIAKLGKEGPNGTANQKRADDRNLSAMRRMRHLLDILYPPAAAFATIPGNTMVCRCESVSANEIRNLAELGCTGPNQARAFTRAGMGPCMGRQCGLAISGILAQETGRSMQEVGTYSIRTPVKPITLAQLANLAEE